MGLKIYAIDETAQPPVQVVLRLCCDGDHGFLQPTISVFAEPNYVEQRTAASRAGWKVSADGHVFGPCCSGKRAIDEDADG